MVESSDLQAAIQRTQAMERVQALQAQQEELNRKRFELEMARESAEKGKKVQDSPRAESRRVARDRYRGGGDSHEENPEEPPPDPRGSGEGNEEGPPEGGTGRIIDVRV